METFDIWGHFKKAFFDCVQLLNLPQCYYKESSFHFIFSAATCSHTISHLALYAAISLIIQHTASHLWKNLEIIVLEISILQALSFSHIVWGLYPHFDLYALSSLSFLVLLRR